MNEISRRMLSPGRGEAPASARFDTAPIAPPLPTEPPRGRTLRPPRGNSGPVGVLDIGTTKIVCLIGRADGDGTIRVLGCGWQGARGVRGGGISDLEEAEQAIRTTVAQAEEMAEMRLRNVTVNLTCGQPESRLFNVQWPVGGRAITEQDVRRVMLEGRSRAWSEGRETIHSIPLAFDVDEMTGVDDPRGLHCETLAARLHIIDATATALRNLSTCIARCDLDIAELVSAPMAAGLATLVEDERQLGATVIDMGGGTSGMAVFAEGQVRHTAQLPIGGAHVTNDIARLLSTTVAHAERLKTLYGNCEGSPDDEREMLPVPLVGEEEHQISRIPRSSVVRIIRPRLEETFEMVRERLEGSGLGRAAGTRVVLTGGACQLPGAREMAARILGRQVRLGRPMNLRGLPDASSGPAFATAAGLLAWTAGQGRPLVDIDVVAERPPGLLGKFANFLRNLML
jgi:cell division protein FtsA